MNPIVNAMKETYGKVVKAICVNGEEYVGRNVIFTHAYDNENGECDIILQLNDGDMFGLFESDIISLEVVNA